MPAQNQKTVLFFKDIDKNDVPLVGGKGANLGEMVQIGLPVPPGFVITASAYDLFLKANGLEEKIYSLLSSLDTSDPVLLQETAKQIQKMITSATIPPEIVKEVIKSYSQLSGWVRKAIVAVRSSATAEDLPTTSFAGQQISFLNVEGENNLLQALKSCWASLFTGRFNFLSGSKQNSSPKSKIAVIVQKWSLRRLQVLFSLLIRLPEKKTELLLRPFGGWGK